MRGTLSILLVVLLATLTLASAHAQGGYDPTRQSASLQYNEARTVYLGNLARRENGAPPLRWNLPLTHAARWFSWDSTENRPAGFCGHQDTLGGWPGDRARRFGYLGFAGAENAFCGYVTPEYAIQGWMNSAGHRANLLDPNHREVGLGYYRRESDGRGYVAQGFGSDPVYPPVVIENEAISTTHPTVGLYIHDRQRGGGFAGLGPAIQMMVSENPCFMSATWEPYQRERTWTFSGGSGWRTVYVRTRDALSRTVTVSDAIYLGTDVPLEQLDTGAAPPPRSQVTLYGLDSGPFPQVQFSLGWLADDTFETFTKWWGNGERVSDPAAWGGTAYRLYPGSGESFAWVWDTVFPIRDVPLVAYFRLKVNSNTSTAEVARISVKGGGTEYGPLRLKGTDFAAPNQYQEFAIPFTFRPTEQDPFLIFQFWRSGTADLYVDAVSIFTVPQPAASPLTWIVPGGNYRGQGIWVRYTDGTRFSGITEVFPERPYLQASPSSLSFLVRRGGPSQTLPVRVIPHCGPFSWRATADRTWLRLRTEGEVLWVEADPLGLSVGTYTGTVTIAAVDQPAVPSVSVPVRLTVAEEVFAVYLPLIRK
ncbi:MAG: CAP domain-containing protein [Anaerolineae bacterium]|nr:CAP domain-containing protein [Anaerolineae bacterium]